jgi:Transposase IS116/IS110/IS902 family
MRRKIPQLEEAPRGHFDDHHGFICATMLRRIDALAADIAALDARIADVVTPHLEVIDRLDEIPGVGSRSAEELIAEIGLDMTVFPTAAHLASWAKFAPSTPNPRDGAKPAPPARATHGWRSPSARSWRRCLAPTPSPVAATGGCPTAAARNAPSSPSATPC